MVLPVFQLMSRFLLESIQLSTDVDFDRSCLSMLKFYAYDEPAVYLLKRAMLDEEWTLRIYSKTVGLVLTFTEKIFLIKLLCMSSFVTDEERDQMRARVWALVAKGNVFDNLVSLCEWGVPSADKKAILW